jgi:putative FmdB family regulatory protein
MPTYEYSCSECKKRFSLVMTIREHDKRRVKCPKCASQRVTQAVQDFFATTSKKS